MHIAGVGPQLEIVPDAEAGAGVEAGALVVLTRRDGDRVEVLTSGIHDLGVDDAALVARHDHKGGAGSVATTVLPPLRDVVAPWGAALTRAHLIGIGDGGSTDVRRAGAAIARACAGTDSVDVQLPVSVPVDALVEGILLASYRAPFHGTGDGPTPAVTQVRLVVAAEGDESAVATQVVQAQVAAAATWTARELTATPSNIKTPAWFAERATALAAQAGTGVSVTVHDERWIAEQGMGGLLAVGGGSAAPPRFVVVDHAPAGASGDPVVLVGKGITFDSGGLSLKPAEAMVPMKTDMSGAAIVLAAVLGAAAAQVPRRVVGLLPLAENMIGAASYRPGDVIRTLQGITVEIGNTDAEGRLVLADAMTWGRDRLSPAVLVDVATLTGAASLGLGKGHGALYSTEQSLTDALVAAADAAGEPLWPMPLVADYADAISSDIADLHHIATDSRVGAGSITAALFLQHFAGDVPWAHLDIAGPARAAGDRFEITQGPTGFSARTLLRWLLDRS